MCSPAAYDRIKPQLAKKNWEFIGFTNDSIILRVETSNIKFSRTRGTIMERMDLSTRPLRGR